MASPVTGKDYLFVALKNGRIKVYNLSISTNLANFGSTRLVTELTSPINDTQVCNPSGVYQLVQRGNNPHRVILLYSAEDSGFENTYLRLISYPSTITAAAPAMLHEYKVIDKILDRLQISGGVNPTLATIYT